MTYPLISVIVPVHNMALYLEKCLHSLLGQTYPNLEIILIDDGSTDNSPCICEHYAHSHKHIKFLLREHEGVSLARNAGIDAAAGSFLGFVDSDDFCAYDMYETLYNLIEHYHTSVAAVNYYEINKNQIKSSPFGFKKNVLQGEDAIISCVIGPQSFPCNKLFARELFSDIRFPANRIFEDLATCYRLYDKAGAIAVSDRPLYYYNRENLSSITKRSFSIKKLDYFKSSSELLAFCRKRHYNHAANIILQERIWHISSFLYQMLQSNFKDDGIIDPLITELRENLWLHWKSPHKITNKLFATLCCINFTIAQHFYRFFQNIGGTR